MPAVLPVLQIGCGQIGETVRNVEARFRRSDGTEFDGLLSVAPLEVEDRRYWIGAVGVLQVVARRLRATVRQPDTVIRIGGDEFAVLLEGASGKEEVTSVAGRIATAFMERVEKRRRARFRWISGSEQRSLKSPPASVRRPRPSGRTSRRGYPLAPPSVNARQRLSSP